MSEKVTVTTGVATKSAAEVRADLLARREIALLDVREEAIHAEGHPLFAANLPFSRIELEAYTRIPRLNTPIVVFDSGEGLAARAADRLAELGYGDVKLLDDELDGWRKAGYELFRDVNAPSKAFGELVEAQRHTPSLSAQELQGLIEAGEDIVIVDARRFDEYQTMSIPTAVSVPGAELVLRVAALRKTPKTRVIVNCAGRTRSIIGTQSLINAGLFPSVAALRNGTIGWKLAGQSLDHGRSLRFSEPYEEARAAAASAARRVADRAGVQRIDLEILKRWVQSGDRTVYRFDVRTPEEYIDGHLPGFRNAPGGQLVQETDMFAPVRGARIVLADDRGVRADMTASWLKQMGWDVYVVDVPAHLWTAELSERGEWPVPFPPLPQVPADRLISPELLQNWIFSNEHRLQELKNDRHVGVVVLDLSPSTQYTRSHIPGACFALLSTLPEALEATPRASRYVLTSSDGVAARFAWAEAKDLASVPVYLLEGGNKAWSEREVLVAEEARYASQPIDRYKRPYEGTDAPATAMQAYLDWEFGLVEQLERDGTHGFFVI
jgi:rhodanese-related sulfurtransferase